MFIAISYFLRGIIFTVAWELTPKALFFSSEMNFAYDRCSHAKHFNHLFFFFGESYAQSLAITTWGRNKPHCNLEVLYSATRLPITWRGFSSDDEGDASRHFGTQGCSLWRPEVIEAFLTVESNYVRLQYTSIVASFNILR